MAPIGLDEEVGGFFLAGFHFFSEIFPSLSSSFLK
jgi:hypothetical protein